MLHGIVQLDLLQGNSWIYRTYVSEHAALMQSMVQTCNLQKDTTRMA